MTESAEDDFDLTHWKEVCHAHEAELQWMREALGRAYEAHAENARLRAALKLIAAGVDTFAINPSGLPDIVVEGGSRFAHERDILPLIYAARDVLYLDGQKERMAHEALAREVKP